MPGHHGESQTQKSDVLDSDSGSVGELILILIRVY